MTDKHISPPPQALSDDDLEALLGTVDFVKAPDTFTDSVMQAVNELPEHDAPKQSEWWQWVALIGGGIPAVLQVLAFIFSTWNVANLG